jgi:hypothetical protein
MIAGVSRNKMLRFLTLTVIGLQITGCTAYREISKGSINDDSYWAVEHGWGRNYSRETTGIRSKNELLLVTPCNYGKKTTFMVAPIPLPLGSVSGVENIEHFAIDFLIYANHSDIRIDLTKIRLTLANSNEYYPSVISPQYSHCEKHNLALSSNLEEYENVFVVKGGSVGIALQYPIVTPRVNEMFTLSIENYISDGEQVSVPPITFEKASSWGGW